MNLLTQKLKLFSRYFVILAVLTLSNAQESSIVEIDDSGITVEADGEKIELLNDSIDVTSTNSQEKNRSIVDHNSTQVTNQAHTVVAGNEDREIINQTIKTNGDGIWVIGNSDVIIRGCTINADKNGIVIQGNGDVIIENSQIKGTNAITIQGNGELTLKNCNITGTLTGLLLVGNADANATNSRIQGGVRKQGNSDFNDLGGNTIS